MAYIQINSHPRTTAAILRAMRSGVLAAEEAERLLERIEAFPAPRVVDPPSLGGAEFFYRSPCVEVWSNSPCQVAFAPELPIR